MIDHGFYEKCKHFFTVNEVTTVDQLDDLAQDKSLYSIYHLFYKHFQDLHTYNYFRASRVYDVPMFPYKKLTDEMLEDVIYELRRNPVNIKNFIVFWIYRIQRFNCLYVSI